jgi:hypothetical protein
MDQAQARRSGASGMTTKPSAGANNDQMPLPRFLVVDHRVPASIRQLLDEADGCLNMSFTTGGTACARRATDAVMETEGVLTDDYSASLVALGKKHPSIAPTLFTVLDLLGTGDEALPVDALKALIAIVKAITYEIYVLGAERIENVEYLSELIGALKQPARPQTTTPGAGGRARRQEYAQDKSEVRSLK